MTEGDLIADENRFAHYFWWEVDDESHFKCVYRWNLENLKEPNLEIDENGNIKVK